MTELDTFIKKFYQLWNAGLTAHLDVNTHAGTAWVGLRVQLGHAPGPPHHPPQPHALQAQKKVASPSRQRRRARRAAARLANASNNKKETSQDSAIEEIDNLNHEEIDQNVEETVIDETSVQEHPTTVEGVVDDKAVTEEASATRGPLFITDIDDEFCEDEEFFDEIDPEIAMTCLVCNAEHFPANYKPGDKVNKYAVCRWHLGVSKCVNCGKNLIGLGVIRDHRKLCRAPS